MNPASILWFVLLVVFLVVEAACPIHLVSLWFAAGALVAAIISLLGGQLWLQVTAFLVVSVALLAALWPVVKKFIRPKITATNVDATVGSQGYVTAQVDNLNAQGQVKLNGMEWTARSTDGQIIPQAVTAVLHLFLPLLLIAFILSQMNGKSQ